MNICRTRELDEDVEDTRGFTHTHTHTHTQVGLKGHAAWHATLRAGRGLGNECIGRWQRLGVSSGVACPAVPKPRLAAVARGAEEGQGDAIPRRARLYPGVLRDPFDSGGRCWAKPPLRWPAQWEGGRIRSCRARWPWRQTVQISRKCLTGPGGPPYAHSGRGTRPGGKEERSSWVLANPVASAQSIPRRRGLRLEPIHAYKRQKTGEASWVNVPVRKCRHYIRC